MFEFLIKFAKILFARFDFLEKTQFVFLLMSLPGANLVTQTRLVFFTMSLPGAIFVINIVFIILKSFAVVLFIIP